MSSQLKYNTAIDIELGEKVGAKVRTNNTVLFMWWCRKCMNCKLRPCQPMSSPPPIESKP